MAKGGDGKISNSIVAASCAAILAVYTAGYSRTRDAAEKFEAQDHERRPARSERAAAATPAEEGPVETSAVAPQTVREADAPAARVLEAPPTSPAPEQEPAAKAVETPAIVPVPATKSVAEVPAPAAPVVAPAPAPAPVAAPSPAAPPPPAPPVAPKWKDGTYTGWGTSRHGDIEARVVIHEGRIVESGISQCLTRYSCDVIDRLIAQPVQRQSPDIDYVSRATESSDAYYFAIVEALNKAVPSTTSAQ